MLWFSIKILGLMVVGSHASYSQPKFFCGGWFSWGQQPSVSAFQSARIDYRQLDLKSAMAPDQKVGVLTAVLEEFFGRKLVVPTQKPEKWLKRLLKQTGLKSGVFTQAEVAHALQVLISRFDRQVVHGTAPEKVREWLFSDFKGDIRQSIENDLLANPELGDLLEELTLPESVDPRITSRMRTRGNLAVVGKTLLIDAILVLLSIPPLHAPNLQFQEYDPTHPDDLEMARRSSIQAATELAATHLQFWGKTNAWYRSVRKLYSTSLLVFGLGYLVFHPAVLAAPVNLWITGWKYHHMTEAQLRDYEEKQFKKPSAIVDEQLQSWVDGQSTPPTPQQIAEKRKFFEKQERDGVLRVFKRSKGVKSLAE